MRYLSFPKIISGKGEDLGHVAVSNYTQGNGERSAIDLPEHDVERADDRRDIGQHMPAAQEIHRLQMGMRCAGY